MLNLINSSRAFLTVEMLQYYFSSDYSLIKLACIIIFVALDPTICALCYAT